MILANLIHILLYSSFIITFGKYLLLLVLGAVLDVGVADKRKVALTFVLWKLTIRLYLWREIMIVVTDFVVLCASHCGFCILFLILTIIPKRCYCFHFTDEKVERFKEFKVKGHTANQQRSITDKYTLGRY